jgi:putative addiction module killer protein
MKVLPREIVVLETPEGKTPFLEWFNSLKDKSYQRAIDARLARIEDGNFGDHKSVGEGVFELRIPRGPGLRVYYGLDGSEIVVLIGGGDKSTQKKDIKRAQQLLKEFFDAK